MKPSLMENLLGLLRIRVKRGVNLAVRDLNSSDPYVIVKMGKQVNQNHNIYKCLSIIFIKFTNISLIWELKIVKFRGILTNILGIQK